MPDNNNHRGMSNAVRPWRQHALRRRKEARAADFYSHDCRGGYDRGGMQILRHAVVEKIFTGFAYGLDGY